MPSGSMRVNVGLIEKTRPEQMMRLVHKVSSCAVCLFYIYFSHDKKIKVLAGINYLLSQTISKTNKDNKIMEHLDVLLPKGLTVMKCTVLHSSLLRVPY